MALRGVKRVGLATLPEIGSNTHGFDVVSWKKHSDYNVEVVEFQHAKTGAKYVHVDTEDTNNGFCVGFCTPCHSDSGVAHILEHTALTGSKAYPVRDPFFKMRTRSLTTYMNALTYPDCTMYPFSTVNDKDFDNMLDIYLDAAFFPLLRKNDFLQEGHRLEVEDGKYSINGVVFNEMKGVYGDPSMLFMWTTMNEVYGRDSCYGYASGGLPRRITDLTHEDLVKFHRDHYSPVNATVATYGDLPVEKHMARINDVLVQRLEEDKANGIVGTRKHLVVNDRSIKRQPRRIETTGPLDPLQDIETSGVRVALAWVTDLSDPFTIFAMSILSMLLTSGPNAPLYQELIEKAVGTEFTGGTGFSSTLKGGGFEVGLQGVQQSKYSTEQVETLILDCLRKVAKDGFTKEYIESIVHQVELANASRSAGWGLDVLRSVVHGAVQGYNVHDTFEVQACVKQLRDTLAEKPDFLQTLLVEHVERNQHRLTHTMSPDAAHSEKVAAQEADEQLPEVSAGADEAAVKEAQAALAKEMDRKEDISVLPTLTTADIPEQPLPDPRVDLLEHPKLKRLQNVVTPTNGVWYLRLAVPIAHLSAEELQLLPTFCAVLGATGAGELNYRDLSQEFDLCSSGLQASISVATDPKFPGESTSALHLSSSGLERCWDRFIELLTLVAGKGRMDSADEEIRVRVQSIITMDATNASNSIVSSAHVYALKHAASLVDKYERCKESVEGLTQVAYKVDMKNAVQAEGGAGADALTKVIDDLRALAGKLLVAHPALRASVTTSAALTEAQRAQLDSFVDSLPECDISEDTTTLRAAEETSAPEAGRVFVPSPSEVGYVGTVCYTRVVAPPLSHSL